MSRAIPQMRQLAERLMTHESSETQPSGTRTQAAFRVFEKLRTHLATLMGSAGSLALFSRALALALPQASWLRAVHLRPDGSLEVLGEQAAQILPEDVVEGNVVLLAELLGLLTALIGEGLTLQMARQVWPTLSLKDFDAGRG